MNSRTMSAVLAEPRAERYQRAERALWDHYNLQPIVHFVELESPRVRLRVLEVGAGKPLLFIHGTVGQGTADPVGSPELWRRVVGALPHGELQWVDGAGHMPWFDDPRQVTA